MYRFNFKDCEDNATKKQCTNRATHKIEKNDLSHRTLFLCEEHTKPYLKFPKDFIVSEIK